MIKTITISDIHGRNNWMKCADIAHLMCAEPDAAGYGPFEPEYNKYIFLGDYVDSFNITSVEILYNLKEIIRFKTLYPDYVELLLGNHELHYYLDTPGSIYYPHRCSGYRPEMHFDLHELFRANRHLFNLAFQIDNTLWTHAGVHTGWYRYRFLPAYNDSKSYEPDIIITNIAGELNYAFERQIECIFDVDPWRGGNKKVGGPFWLDRRLGISNPLLGLHQIVGHTPVSDIKIHKFKGKSITFCDVLEHQEKFYIKEFR